MDLVEHKYFNQSDEFIQGDLTNQNFAMNVLAPSKKFIFDEVYQLAADMGGAGYIFTGENDSSVMYNSSIINLNVLNGIIKTYPKNLLPKIFYSSSACIYPEEKQLKSENFGLRESDAYPANPDSEYGWEKLFSERLYFSYYRNFGLPVRVGRFHNIYGPYGAWNGGREKAPAALCRKVAEAGLNGEIEIWGSGNQTRSFLYIEDCIDAIIHFMRVDFQGPLNIGSEENISINDLARLIAKIAKKNINIINKPGPVGVNGRNSNNELVRSILNWDVKYSLRSGLEITYEWIKNQVENKKQ